MILAPEQELIDDIDPEQYFTNKVMTIPEEEGVDALDQACLISDVKDLLESFRGYEETLRKDYEPGEDYISSTSPIFYRCPSIESFFKQGRGASVFIYLFPGRKMISKEVRLDTTVFQLKVGK